MKLGPEWELFYGYFFFFHVFSDGVYVDRQEFKIGVVIYDWLWLLIQFLTITSKNGNVQWTTDFNDGFHLLMLGWLTVCWDNFVLQDFNLWVEMLWSFRCNYESFEKFNPLMGLEMGSWFVLPLITLCISSEPPFCEDNFALAYSLSVLTLANKGMFSIIDCSWWSQFGLVWETYLVML